MGMLHEEDPDSLAKLLLIADSKAGKTHWAMQAAEAGFNVLYMDGDVGRQTLAKLTPAAKKRIFYMNVGDRMSERGAYDYRFANVFKEFTTTGIFTWNDSKGDVFDRRDYDSSSTLEGDQAVSSGDDVFQIRPAKMDSRDVIIFDSWTSYVQSISAWKADSLGVDLSDIEKAERGHYAGIANKATQALVMIQRAPCHVIVIAHPDEYQKKKSPTGTVKTINETDMIIEWTKMVPKSTSRPHSLTMAKYFSDVAWLDVSVTGKRSIDMKATNARIIGGHFDDSKPVEERTFADLVKQIGGAAPDPATNSMDRWLTPFMNGTFVPAGAKPATVLGAKAETTQGAASAPATPASPPVTPAKGFSAFGIKNKGVDK